MFNAVAVRYHLVDMRRLAQQVGGAAVLVRRRVLAAGQDHLAVVHQVRVERHRGRALRTLRKQIKKSFLLKRKILKLCKCLMAEKEI